MAEAIVGLEVLEEVVAVCVEEVVEEEEVRSKPLDILGTAVAAAPPPGLRGKRKSCSVMVGCIGDSGLDAAKGFEVVAAIAVQCCTMEVRAADESGELSLFFPDRQQAIKS
jgi:hypothetical protein